MIISNPVPVLALLAAFGALPRAAAAHTLAITDVTVADVREGVARPGMTVVVSGDRITADGPGAVAPGSTVLSSSERWREANGSGIRLSPGSDSNEIVGNMFDDIASSAVIIEGDSNRVELRSTSDAVRDLGSDNRVSAPDHGNDPASGLTGPARFEQGQVDATRRDTVH